MFDISEGKLEGIADNIFFHQDHEQFFALVLYKRVL